MKEEEQTLMVTVLCLTYNQERYVRQCLEGVVMQQTNFRFEAIVHDDASTDGTADIIREYAEKYPDIIKPIFETENQYSKHDGSLRRIMDEHTHGKYVAVCEGDDYWIDSLKLQKQFDFMEAHPDCSMCFHANYDLLPSGVKRMHKPKDIKDFYSPEDTILGGGGFMATNSMFYRGEYLQKEERPDFWKNCPIGDCPSMLYYASKGMVGYIDEVMSVYRCQAIGSWSSRQNSVKIRTKHYKAILNMFDEYDKYTEFKYHSVIQKKKKKNMRKHVKSTMVFLMRKILKNFGIKK